MGFPNGCKSDSVFATSNGEGDHGKGLFDGFERSGESCREAARLLDLAASTTIRWMHVDHDNWSSFPSRHNRAQRRSCFGEMQNQ